MAEKNEDRNTARIKTGTELTNPDTIRPRPNRDPQMKAVRFLPKGRAAIPAKTPANNEGRI